MKFHEIHLQIFKLPNFDKSGILSNFDLNGWLLRLLFQLLT